MTRNRKCRKKAQGISRPGWRNDSFEHSLAARGLSAKQIMSKKTFKSTFNNLEDIQGIGSENTKKVGKLLKADGINSIQDLDRAWTDKFPGGMADHHVPSDFDVNELMRGTIVELEHTDCLYESMEITMDHLVEDDKYYEKLAALEGEPSTYVMMRKTEVRKLKAGGTFKEDSKAFAKDVRKGISSSAKRTGKDYKKASKEFSASIAGTTKSYRKKTKKGLLVTKQTKNDIRSSAKKIGQMGRSKKAKGVGFLGEELGKSVKGKDKKRKKKGKPMSLYSKR